MDDFERFKTSENEVTADKVEIAREWELAWRCDWLLQSHAETLTNEELLYLDEQRNWFLEMKSPGEDCWNDSKGYGLLT